MEYGKDQNVFRLNAVSLQKVRIYKDGQFGRPVKTVKMRAIGIFDKVGGNGQEATLAVCSPAAKSIGRGRY